MVDISKQLNTLIQNGYEPTKAFNFLIGGNNILYYFVYFLMLAYTIFISRRTLHMLQQNFQVMK